MGGPSRRPAPGRQAPLKILLDTHILFDWFEGRQERLTRDQRRAIERARPGSPLLVSEISLWEVAMLVDLGRIRLDVSLREWLDAATAPPLVERCGITPAVAAEFAALPKTFHRDPADRIIVATARVHGAAVATQDERIAKSGLVPIVA